MKPLNLESDTRILALVSVVLGILMVTLLPAGSRAPGVERAPFALAGDGFLTNVRHTDFVDVIQNILLFSPFGFLIATFIPAGSPEFRRLAWTCVAGLCLSGGVEFLQVWIPGRYPTLSDIALNGMGALCGGVAAIRLARIGPR